MIKKIYFLIIFILIPIQFTFARTRDFSPQELFFMPLVLIGGILLIFFSNKVESLTKDFDFFTRLVVKFFAFILFIFFVGVIIFLMGLIFKYIPEHWSTWLG